MHEFVSSKDFKRVIDCGVHPYTTAFQQFVRGVMMIESADSQSKEGCGLSISAVRAIVEEVETDPDLVTTTHARYASNGCMSARSPQEDADF